MTVLITLTATGLDTGPFNLYSDLDGFTTPFESFVNKSALQAGYESALVPDFTNIIRAQSIGQCVNYTDIVLQNITTTTTTSTTLPPIPCNATASSGGTGVTNQTVTLDATGGVVVVEVTGQGVPDKFEIIHNNVKKATSGMTVANSGPFDNVYGDPTIPSGGAENSIDQFIGTSSTIAGGIVPKREADFLADTGISGVVVEASYQQLVWWKYTAADYLVNPSVTFRVTGPSGTAWNVKRICPAPATTTTSSSSSSTTTTTTTIPVVHYQRSIPHATFDAACADNNPIADVYTRGPVSISPVSFTVYIDEELFTPLAGGGNFFKLIPFGPYQTVVARINGSGHPVTVSSCP